MAIKRNRNNKRLDVFKKRIRGVGKGHPAYIYAKVGNEYKYIGLTSSENVKFKNGENVKTIELFNNPEPGNNEKTYIMPYYEQRPVNHFGKKYKNWRFSFKDKNIVNQVKKQKKS